MDVITEIIWRLILGALSLIVWVFWLWMLIDCILREAGEETKIVWALLIAFTHVIGALLYYFIRRPKRISDLRT